jgi:hypothetical protein
MSSGTSTGIDFFDLLKKRAPEYIDLVTAQTEDQFEQAFCTLLEKALLGMESNKGHFCELDEEGLTAALALALNTPGLTVSQEKHSNGHVDLTIEADHCTPARRKLGEAKIYDGPKYHCEGIEQLLGRYTTGREGRGLLIVYCRKRDIVGKMKGLRTWMDEQFPCEQQGQTDDHTLRWCFRSSHAHASGEIVGVDHVGCNLCTE